MYYWKTHLLVADLAKGALEERTLKNYYLATSILFLISYYLAMVAAHDNYYALAVEAVAALVATVVGLNAAFAANGGDSGTRFLDKVVAISFPLLIKVAAASFAVGLILGVLDALEMSKLYVDWLSSIAFIVVQVVFFLRLVAHVRKINA